jgi:hypothetical protein
MPARTDHNWRESDIDTLAGTAGPRGHAGILGELSVTAAAGIIGNLMRGE